MEEVFVDKCAWNTDGRSKFRNKCLAANIGEPRDIIPPLYTSGMSSNEIAEHLFIKHKIVVSSRAIDKYVEDAGIKRTASEAKRNAMARKRMIYKKKPESEKYHAKYISSADRITILQRDEFKCILCGNGRHNGSSIEIHHKDMNPQNNAHDNLQTLCYLCHRGIHKLSTTSSLRPAIKGV